MPPAPGYLTQVELAWELSAHEAVAQLAVDQEAEAQLAVDHEAEAQLAVDQDAAAQLASDQEALFQDALAVAALAQLAESKVLRPVVASVVTNWFRPAFGLAAPSADAAAEAETIPTPRAPLEP
jgi:leucyl aminopeptidase (aminopeptidase T)